MSLIETKYVPLRQAAEMLETDEDTMLIAACEHRIWLHGLVAVCVRDENADEVEDNLFVKSHTTEDGEDVFVSLYVDFTILLGVAELFRRGKIRVFDLLKDLGSGRSLAGKVDNEDGYVDVTRDQVFMLRTDIEKIRSENKSPESGAVTLPVSTQNPSGQTKREDTLMTIIAALCKEQKIDVRQRGVAVAIANMTAQLGAPVSEGTIKPILDKIPEAVERRTK